MLGRYVGGTVLVLGVAMLMAPQSPEPEQVVSAAAPPAAAPAEARPAATRAASAPAAVDTATTIAAAAVLAPTPERAPEPTLAPQAEIDLAVLALSLDRAESGEVPTLSDLGSVQEAAVTSDTLSLIARAETGAAPIAEPDAERGDGTFFYVTGTRVNVRAGPSTGYSVIDSVSLGESVELVARSDGWAQVVLDGETTGFMSARFLAPSLGDG